jgi:hypothetical protein
VYAFTIVVRLDRGRFFLLDNYNKQMFYFSLYEARMSSVYLHPVPAGDWPDGDWPFLNHSCACYSQGRIFIIGGLAT